MSASNPRSSRRPLAAARSLGPSLLFLLLACGRVGASHEAAVPICGNGQAEPGEECDDGVRNSDTTPGACRTTCRLPRCGDGVVDPGEQCDAGLANSDTTPGACRTSCVAPRCGDGVVDPGETCDDGVNDGRPGHCAPSCTCDAPPFVMAEDLAPPEEGDVFHLISSLRRAFDVAVFPPGIGYSANWGAVSQWLTLDHVDALPSVRWGPIAWEPVEAHVLTRGGNALVETWTIGWAHDLGATQWVSVGAVAPTLRRILDRAVLLNTQVIPWTANPPPFPAELFDAALVALRTESTAALLPLLSTALSDAVALAEAETPVAYDAHTPDAWVTDTTSTSIVTEGSTAYTTLRAGWTSRLGLRHAESWILIWNFYPGEGRWALDGFASSYPRQKLGEVGHWWDMRRTSDHFLANGFYGREALSRLLARNESVEGFTMSSTDPTTQSLASSFSADALQRYGLQSLPNDARQVTNTFAGHLTASYREGTWTYLETPYVTLPRLLEAREGWCESNIVLMSMLRWAGFKARYVFDDTLVTKTEVWTSTGWQAGTFDDGDRDAIQNQNWHWLGSSLLDLSQDSVHTNPHIVVFFCDPHGFCAMRRLYADASTAPLFKTANGLACFDWTTYPFSSVKFLWSL
jgi:hypothetical protein